MLHLYRYLCCVHVYSESLKSDLEMARIKVDTLQLKKNIAESKVSHEYQK